MPSSPQDRRTEVERLWEDADENWEDDMRRASSNAQVTEIDRKHQRAQGLFLSEIAARLGANGAAVEQAYNAAKSANDQVEQGRQNAVNLAQILRDGNAALKAVTSLTRAARG